jgi:hypothetical protein
MTRGRGPVYTNDPETGNSGDYSGLKLLNGQTLPLAGTMLRPGTSKVQYYTDKQLTTKLISEGRPDYPFEISAVSTFPVGIYTGNYYAENGLLKSVQVNHVHSLNQAGEFFTNTPYTSWVAVDLTYDPATQGVLPKEYKIDENGLLTFDFNAIGVTEIDKDGNVVQPKNKKAAILILAGLFLLYVTRKKRKK